MHYSSDLYYLSFYFIYLCSCMRFIYPLFILLFILYIYSPVVLAAQVKKIMLLTKGIILIVVNVVLSVENTGNQVFS